MVINYMFMILMKKNHKILVSKGAIFCKSIEELVPKVSVLITCLPSPKSVKDVILKCVPQLNQKHLWIEMSTTDEKDMKYLSKLVFDKNAEVLEAPLQVDNIGQKVEIFQF